MHARLAGGFPPAPMLSGGWYPVASRAGDRVTISVDGTRFAVHESFLELSEADRVTSVWAFDPTRTGPDGFSDLTSAVVCPAGHHITGLGPSTPRCRCERCGRVYEIET